MPTPFPAGNKITTADVLNAFITQVRNGAGVVQTAAYYAGNTPGGFSDPVPGRLGSMANPASVWPAGMQGQPITTNMFYILHHLAMKLTRIRMGKFVLKHGGALYGNGSPGSFWSNDQLTGWAYVGYNDRNVIGFDMPAIPAPTPAPTATPYPFNGQQLDQFLNALRLAVIDVQGDTNRASEFSACHTSCHTSCHGSRGRR